MDTPDGLFIATPLEDELVERIRRHAAPRTVAYDPALLPSPLYRGDHRGDPTFVRTLANAERWASMLAGAAIVLGIPMESPRGLRELARGAPGLRWVQSMYAGAGETVRAAELPRETLERVTITTSAGIHATMLAEFAFYGILSLRKDAKRLASVRALRSWKRFPMGELRGSTLAVLGVGHIGAAIARLGRAFGMHAIGIARAGGSGRDADAFDEIVTIEHLVEACARCDVLALALPGTPATQRIVGARELAALRDNAIVVNVGRGTTLDQPALLAALRARRLAGAVLDVFDPEPLRSDDPLWTMDNVVMTPHTATLSVHENERIVELFLDNLDRFDAAKPLRNPIDIDELY